MRLSTFRTLSIAAATLSREAAGTHPPPLLAAGLLMLIADVDVFGRVILIVGRYFRIL